jgi:myo-inositol-1(or 4)-monophosphatase
MFFSKKHIQDDLFAILRELGNYAAHKANELRKVKDSKLFNKEMIELLDPWLCERLCSLNSEIGYSGKALIEGNQEVKWITSLWSGSNAFFRNGHLWSVHFGLETNTDYRIGCMYLPMLKELFYAETGHGTKKNGKKMSLITDLPLDKCTGGVGFSCVREGVKDNCIPIFNRLLPQVAFMNILPIGSSSCKIVDGTFDFMFEKELSYNQVYSAAVILEEAGGCVTDFSGKNVIDPSNILFCSNPHLLKSLLPYMD